jgi:hypothetical protein
MYGKTEKKPFYFHLLLDFTNLFNTMIVTTKISRDTAPNPAPMAMYNVRSFSVKDKTA